MRPEWWLPPSEERQREMAAAIAEEERLDELLSGETVGVQAAYEYLSRLHSQLWADWLIHKPERRLEAARWLDEQIRAVNRIRRKGDWNPQ